MVTKNTTYTYSYEEKSAATVTKEPKGLNLTENGEAQELISAGEATGGTMQYALGTNAVTAPTEGWSTSIPTGTNAGAYYVWYRVKVDADHKDTEPKCIAVTIKYGASTLVYNGEDQNLIKPGTAQGGTMVYALGTDVKHRGCRTLTAVLVQSMSDVSF